jgi:16S rRNA (guanine966-N2)-methyltransferase
MRITGGKFRGRTLQAPAGLVTRPTADKTRQAIFNILNHNNWPQGWMLQGANVLDAFCGSGALGLEALSHGANRLWLLDNQAAAIKTAQDNANKLGASRACVFLPMKIENIPPAPLPCQLIFLDPPYQQNLLPAAIATLQQQNWITAQTLIVTECAAEEKILLPLQLHKERVAGVAKTMFWTAA